MPLLLNPRALVFVAFSWIMIFPRDPAVLLVSAAYSTSKDTPKSSYSSSCKTIRAPDMCKQENERKGLFISKTMVRSKAYHNLKKIADSFASDFEQIAPSCGSRYSRSRSRSKSQNEPDEERTPIIQGSNSLLKHQYMTLDESETYEERRSSVSFVECSDEFEPSAPIKRFQQFQKVLFSSSEEGAKCCCRVQ